MLNYNTHVKGASAYNTPPVFAVYILGLVAKWLKAQGGLDAMARLNRDKAETLYQVIDASEFYSGHALPDHRSRMNVTLDLVYRTRKPRSFSKTRLLPQGWPSSKATGPWGESGPPFTTPSPWKESKPWRPS